MRIAGQRWVPLLLFSTLHVISAAHAHATDYVAAESDMMRDGLDNAVLQRAPLSGSIGGVAGLLLQRSECAWRRRSLSGSRLHRARLAEYVFC